VKLILEKVESKYSTSVGPSMYPTIRSGDGLRVDKEFNFDQLKIGDVIVFKNAEKDFNIVHRILRKIETGYITRGDNNTKYDPNTITVELFIGKVYAFKRKNKIVKVYGGFSGYIFHKLMIVRMHIYPPVKKILKYIYKKTVALGLFYWVNGTIIKPELIFIEKNGIKQPNLIWKGKIIAFKSLKTDKWIIRFPYRFFIEKDSIKKKK
jgi:signal peptidase I